MLFRENIINCISQDDLNKFKELIIDIDINESLDDGYSLLHWTCQEKAINIIKYLINNVKSIEIEDIHGFTPFNIAVNEGFTEGVKLFIEKGIDINKKCKANKNTPLHNACIWNHIDIVKLLVENGAILDVCDDRGRTPLFESVFHQNKKIERYLLKKGARIDIKDENGYTVDDLKNDEIIAELIRKDL